jgi:hypothetical protein
VDDILMVSRELKTTTAIKEAMLTKYRGVTWEPEAKTFIGLALKEREDGSLKVTQAAYTQRVIEVTGTGADGTTLTPNTLGNVGEGEVNPRLIPWMRKAVGLTQFLTLTRMEITTALNLVARQMHKSTARTRTAMENILMYIANRPDD